MLRMALITDSNILTLLAANFIVLKIFKQQYYFYQQKLKNSNLQGFYEYFNPLWIIISHTFIRQTRVASSAPQCSLSLTSRVYYKSNRINALADKVTQSVLYHSLLVQMKNKTLLLSFLICFGCVTFVGCSSDKDALWSIGQQLVCISINLEYYIFLTYPRF